MFRARSVVRCAMTTAVFDKQFVKNETTHMSEPKLVSAVRVLPPIENFDLKTMVEAGVDLQRQNSMLFDSRPVDLSQFEGADEKETETIEQQPIETKE